MKPLRPDAPAPRLARLLRAHLPLGPGVEPHLRTVLEETLAHSGRLLRARLVLAATRTHGWPAVAAERLACAVEYYHGASLLLDDLPCMDNARQRRGRTCPHLIHGEATVILAALALINRAYTLAGAAFASQPAGVQRAARTALDDCLGIGGILGGQAADLRFGESDGSARTVEAIARAKTGALLQLAIRLPVLPLQLQGAEARLLDSLCLYWGLAYQAADDLSDQLLPEEKARPDAGRSRVRPNLARALGAGPAQRRVARLLAQAQRCLVRLTALHPRWAYLTQFHGSIFAAHELPGTHLNLRPAA